MALVRNELTWGEEHATPQAPDMRAWKVELESEPLGPLVGTALTRFCHDARHRAPQSEPSCTLSSGRIGMVLTVAADGRDDAVRQGGQVFMGALEAALWPRSELASDVHFDVSVAPSDRAAA
jgi:hypothetical protein